jgi:hypothetical protein
MVVVCRRRGPRVHQPGEHPVLYPVSFGENWQIGTAPNILIDWKADQDNRFTVPIGLGVGKLIKIGPLPVKLTAEVDYMVIHPDDFGQHWCVRFQIIPVLPALFKDTLF